MGDPKKIRKKYDTPSHPWIKSRIDDEKRIARAFGTKNKKEIWKLDTVLKNFKKQAKHLIALDSKQSKIETEHLFRRMGELGLIQGEVTFDAILGLVIDDLMARRLQTVVFKKGLAHSVGQARQFIVHEHILVDDKKITSPAYLVSVHEEATLGFAVSSALYSEDHPERASPEKLAEMAILKKSAKEDAEKKVAAEKPVETSKETSETPEASKEEAKPEDSEKKAEAKEKTGEAK